MCSSHANKSTEIRWRKWSEICFTEMETISVLGYLTNVFNDYKIQNKSFSMNAFVNKSFHTTTWREAIFKTISFQEEYKQSHAGNSGKNDKRSAKGRKRVHVDEYQVQTAIFDWNIVMNADMIKAMIDELIFIKMKSESETSPSLRLHVEKTNNASTSTSTSTSTSNSTANEDDLLSRVSESNVLWGNILFVTAMMRAARDSDAVIGLANQKRIKDAVLWNPKLRDETETGSIVLHHLCQQSENGKLLYSLPILNEVSVYVLRDMS